MSSHLGRRCLPLIWNCKNLEPTCGKIQAVKTSYWILAGLAVGAALVSNALVSSAEAQATKPFIPAGFKLESDLSKTRVTTFKAPKYVLADNTDYRAVVETDKGRMILELYEDDTPVTVNSFVFLARNKFFDGIVFHRIIDGFMAQTGDPLGLGTGGPGYQYGDEIRQKLTFDKKNLLAMANSGPATNGSQFFITFVPTPHLNGKHTIFGRLLEGEKVLNALNKGEPPATPSKMTKVYIVSKKR
jgi:cyclophilin family peptidyl-prolyl cis-trans isomerase